jgi:hypothetical protein
MAAKGLVRRDESGRAHIYEAAEPRGETEARLVRRLADRVVLMENGGVKQQGRPDEVEIPRDESLQELAPRI